MRPVSPSERRARLGLRQGLAASLSTPLDAVSSVVCLHSSDPATVFLSVWARTDDFAIEDLERDLYEERTLIRMHGMRRTLWVVPRDEMETVESSTTRDIAAKARRATIKAFEQGGIADDAGAWLDEITPKVLKKVEDEGQALTRDLTSTIPGLDERIELYSKAGKLMGTVGVGSRVLLQLSMESRLVRGRPAGTWLSSQYRWSTMETWLGEALGEIPTGEAAARLAASWLYAFGPGTEEDLRWWTGWPVSRVRKALAANDAAQVDLGGRVGYLLPDDADPVVEPPEWVALLPSLDPTTMGWKERDWYLGPYGDVLFDRNGNAGPTIWVDGRIVGGWGQREDGSVVYEMFEDVGSDSLRAVEGKISELEGWLAGLGVAPRFRSPHHKRLGS